jgi:hypothetical protein
MEVVRVGFQEDPSISRLTDILSRHDAIMQCQFDAFAGYVSEAEANAALDRLAALQHAFAAEPR